MRMRGLCLCDVKRYNIHELCNIYEYNRTLYLACAVQEYYTVHKYYTSIIMTNSVSKQCIVINSYD